MTAANQKLPSHIYKEGNRYRVRYRKSQKYPVPFDSSYDTLEEAISEKEQYLAKLTLSVYNVNTKKDIGFADFCDYVLDWYRNKPKKPSQNTLRSYKQYMNRVKGHFGNKKLREITALDIENMLKIDSKRAKQNNGMKGETISGNTLHHEYTMLRTILNKAKRWGFIEFNPIDVVEAPVFEAKPIEVPEFSELSDIEAKIMTAPIRDRCIFLLAFYTGMRAEEVAGVHIEDFDYEKLTVKVRRAIVQNEITNEYEEGKLKSHASIREIPLPKRFFETLDLYLKTYRDVHIRKILNKSDGQYKVKSNLFLNDKGGFMTSNRVSRLWGLFRKKVGIDMTFHGLRHYYITNQMNYNDNLSPRDVQKIAGHSNIKTTYKYVHPSQDRINDNATNIYSQFGKEDLYKNGQYTLTIPIEHIATIILGNPDFSRIDDLKVTLSELSDKEVDFFNISDVMINCRDYLKKNYPALSRIEKYNYIDKKNIEVIKELKSEFGKDFIVSNHKEKGLGICL